MLMNSDVELFKTGLQSAPQNQRTVRTRLKPTKISEDNQTVLKKAKNHQQIKGNEMSEK